MVTRQSIQEIDQLFTELSLPEFLDQIPGHVFLKDRDGVLLKCNQRVLEMLQEDPVGKTDSELLLRKDEVDQIRNNDKQAMESQKPMVFIEKLTGKNGKVYTFCCIKAPLFDKQGNVIGVIGHGTDMTDMGPQLKNF